jgi:hypothetical protein
MGRESQYNLLCASIQSVSIQRDCTCPQEPKLAQGPGLHHVVKPHNLTALDHSAHHPSQDPSMPQVLYTLAGCGVFAPTFLCTMYTYNKLIYTYHIDIA